MTFSIWDHLFKTYQKELHLEKPVYGITREMDSENLLETQTDEFTALWRDVKNASGWINKLKYLIMPPGWHPLHGEGTAKYVREAALRKLEYKFGD